MSKIDLTSDFTTDQAESWMLGRLLLNPSLLMEIRVGLHHFVNPMNASIFEVILQLDSQGKMIDVVTVADELDRQYPNKAVWLAVCGQYVNDSFSDTMIHSAQTVMIERYREREIKKIAASLAQNFEPDEAVQALMDLDKAERKYSYTTAESAMAAIEHAQECAKHDGIPGLRTGLQLLDVKIGGLQSPDLYVIGARPAMGKTALIINWMLNHDCPVGFFSTEQPHEQVGLRMISMSSSVPAQKIRTAQFDDSENNRMAAAVTKLASKQIHIYDKGYLTLQDLQREARRMAYTHGIKVIYVDYIQRVRAKAENRRLEVSEVVTGLKSLAKELGIPVVALAQVNREVDKRSDPRPGTADLLESGVIEQEADAVMTLYRDEVYHEGSKDKGVIEILLNKNRHGPIGKFRFAWLPETMQVRNLIQEAMY